MVGKWRQFRHVLQRRRVFSSEDLEASNLRRCLKWWDLTALGLGSTLGVGVYVIVGTVALKTAGPSIVLSFLIAALASMFAGLCYAELSSRVPRTGSAYIYTYVTVGEFVAFVIGWNLVLEGVFGTASVARGLSCYIDSMSGGVMSQWFLSVAPLATSTYFSPYFDLFAFFIVIILGLLLSFGVRESSAVNNVFTTLNALVIVFIITVGAFKASPTNWSIPEAEVPTNSTRNFGVGGFFPYGVWGTLQGAAICFYGFVGFEAISAASEEVREPRRIIPCVTISVLLIVFVVYASISTVITMMVPYYALETPAGVATAFSYVGLEWARWIISIGAVFGMMASMFGAMYPLPRVLYAMAGDGLFFHWFEKVSSARQSPIIATLLPALIIAFLAATVELDQLIMVLCIGTLFSYTIVATCVIVLRYNSKIVLGNLGYIKQIFGCGERGQASKTSKRVVYVALFMYVCDCLMIGVVIVYFNLALIPMAILHAIGLVLVVIMIMQPQAKEELSFKTPLVPVVPCLSIYANVLLMTLINIQSWVRVLIWLAIGIPVYLLCLCCYKRKGTTKLKSKTNRDHKQKNGKAPIEIVVEAPTPTDTIKTTSNYEEIVVDNTFERESEMKDNKNKDNSVNDDEIIIQEAVLENSEEKEAKIIGLLDEMLQAEEDTLGEVISLKEIKQDTPVDIDSSSSMPHRMSLSELSDAGSDASLGNQVLSKYDVIAQVHREDLPKVNEEEEKHEKDTADLDETIPDIDKDIDTISLEDTVINHEEITAFNDSDNESHTDESGYSDTLDRNLLNGSNDGLKDTPYIPTPPPLDESFFADPLFKKAYTMPVKIKSNNTDYEEEKPRESVLSNHSQYSQDDGNIVFGSDRQMNFMSKLNNIFQTKMSTDSPSEEQRRRSNSTGNINNSELSLPERPTIFFDLKNELLALHSAPNLRPVNPIEKPIEKKEEEVSDEQLEAGLSREDLRSKLENMFAAGGPKPFKAKSMKSKNPPTTPEESYQTDSSTESIPKLPKVEKNDTLKRQKDKFSEVLNSFRLSLNKDDVV